MRRRLLHVLAALCAVSPILPSVPARADDLTTKQQQQQQLQDSIGANKQKIQQDLGQEAVAQAQLLALRGQISDAEASLAAENTHLDTVLGQLDDAQRRLQATREHLAQRQDVLSKRTRSLYKTGGDASFIDSLFTSATFSQLLDRFIVMRDVTHADQLLVVQIQADRVAIEQIVAEQVQKRDEQKQVVANIQVKQDALRGQYVQEAAFKARVTADQSTRESQNIAAQRSLAAVSSEIAALTAARGRAHSSGQFGWPGVQGPITQPFGCTDFAGEPSPPPGYSCPKSQPYFHTGLDIAGPYGSEVDATDGGLAYTYPGNSGYGNHIIVVHANGFTSLYGHLSSFAVTSGSAVAKGQRIGAEGSTGFSSGPHLHFEIRLNNAPQDPCRYVGC
ncbi:MAG TPA: peptidoglycan DD-metalloendopeptidase family protein [Candidatus Dormibacteraeota bacterium]|jgi:murein DD-endopeptidase MepM/ murein hydrolase activator NlpD